MASRLGAYVRRSIEGFRVHSERVRQIEPEKIIFSDVVGIFIRGWPYIQPMFYHVITYVAVAVFQMLWGIFWGLTIFSLIYNNVIIDEPVGALPAAILFLDPAVWVNVEALGAEQRSELVPMVVMLAVVSGTL